MTADPRHAAHGSPGDYAAAVRRFADEVVAPHAAEIDRAGRIPDGLIDALARGGYLVAAAGPGDDLLAAALRSGLRHEALGRVSASVQGLVNVHEMAASTIARWGTDEHRARWLAPLASGGQLGAFAVTEANVGSDAAAVETTARPEGDGHVLTGEKRWITCGQVADLFVVLAGTPGGPAVFVVPRDAAGLTIEPMPPALGCRGYMLAALQFDDCRLDAGQMIGRPGFGLSHVAAVGLDTGRYNLAWGCVGLADACLELAAAHARRRQQFGRPLAEFQLVQRMLARMAVDHQTARLLCERAGRLRGAGDPGAIKVTAMAKYHASKAANRVAGDAVQIHGALGASVELPLERYLRDARIMEIIEGTSQILELAIARYELSERR